jgi:aminoglycoside phosphotransferase (APT) family kinase protein
MVQSDRPSGTIERSRCQTAAMHPMIDTATAIVQQVFGPDASISEVEDIDRGRGVFSHVVRCTIRERAHPVAIKLLRSDPNGESAVTTGAADREVLAYRTILPSTPTVSAPTCFGVGIDESERPALVLEDLSGHRWSDQLDGLSKSDLRLVTTELIELHRRWADPSSLATVDVRRSTPSSLRDDGIDRGLESLSRWSIPESCRTALGRLAEVRVEAVQAFGDEGGDTLCHGDPRADNVAFGDDRAVLFDWQQLAIQFGEADLAWLLATSATPDTRRAVESDLVASYALERGQDAGTTWRRYVTGMVLPGLAVLFLAQRTTDDERTERFIETSIERIATAVDDLGVVELVSS